MRPPTDSRRVLIVSPYFPPSTLAGVHRARLLAKHLPSHGWDPTILCVDERHHEEPLDEGLARLVPAATRILKVGSAPKKLARAFGVGDLSLRSYRALRAAIHAKLGRENVEAVLITVGPFYTSLLGSGIRRNFDVPVVLDYQDPWVSRWGSTLPRWSKGGFSHRLARCLEPLALRGVDWISAVSSGTYEEIRTRHPGIDPERCSEIPIGGDPDDFEAASRLVGTRSPAGTGGELRLSYVGTLLPRAVETARALFAAVARLRVSRPELARRLRIAFLGTSNQPAGGPERVLPIARELGVADLVTEEPRRAPYLEALAHLSRSSAILALGSDERHYTASKIYPALLAGPPVLAIFHEASTVCDVMKKSGGGLLVPFGDGPEAGVSTRVSEIAAALAAVLEFPETIPPLDSAALAPYFAPAIAGRFAKVLDRVAIEGPRGLGL